MPEVNVKRRKLSMPVWPLLYRGTDPFGGPVLDEITGVEALGFIGEAIEGGLLDYTSTHDDDLFSYDPEDPEDYLREGSQIQREIAEVKEIQKKYGIKFNMMTCKLHAHPIFTNGGFTNPNPDIRLLALKKALRAGWIGAQLGAKTITYWTARDGFESVASVPFAGYPRVKVGNGPYQWLKYALDLVARSCKKLGYTQGTIEPKANEPRSVIFLPLVGSALAFINRLEDPSFWGVNPEVLQHSLMAGQSPLLEIVQAVEVGKLPFLHLGSQIPGQYDNDFPPLLGSYGLKPTVEIFYYLSQVGWDGIVEFDCHPLRADCLPGESGSARRHDFIVDCVRNYRLVEQVLVPRVEELSYLILFQNAIWMPNGTEASAFVLEEPISDSTAAAIQKAVVDMKSILESPAETAEVESRFNWALLGVTAEEVQRAQTH